MAVWWNPTAYASKSNRQVREIDQLIPNMKRQRDRDTSLGIFSPADPDPGALGADGGGGDWFRRSSMARYWNSIGFATKRKTERFWVLQGCMKDDGSYKVENSGLLGSCRFFFGDASADPAGPKLG